MLAGENRSRMNVVVPLFRRFSSRARHKRALLFREAFGGDVANRFDVARSTANYRLQHTIRKIPRALMRRISA